MKIKKLLLILIIFSLTSCYDNKELNNIAIATATEINKIDNEYIINVEIANPQAPDKTISIKTPYIIYTGHGKTINEAYRQIKTSSPKYLYPEHLQILIINESIAKNNLQEVLDFYLRSPLIRTEFNILIAKDNNILSTSTNIDERPSKSILNTIKTNKQYYGTANTITLNELTSNIINPNTEPVIPSIKLKDDKYELSGLAIFKNNKLVGYLTNEESIIYNLIKNNTQNNIFPYECDKDKYLSLEIITSKSIIKVNNNSININIDINAAINESNCNINLNNAKSIDNLEKKISAHLNDIITNTINNIKNKYNTDIFNFLDEIYKHNYKKYLRVKETWYEKEYQNIKININSHINITSRGSYMEDINEKN